MVQRPTREPRSGVAARRITRRWGSPRTPQVVRYSTLSRMLILAGRVARSRTDRHCRLTQCRKSATGTSRWSPARDRRSSRQAKGRCQAAPCHRQSGIVRTDYAIKNRRLPLCARSTRTHFSNLSEYKVLEPTTSVHVISRSTPVKGGCLGTPTTGTPKVLSGDGYPTGRPRARLRCGASIARGTHHPASCSIVRSAAVSKRDTCHGSLARG